MTVEENLSRIMQNIDTACQRTGRNPNDVKIIAVTKYVSEQKTREVLDAGVMHIGESRVESGVNKRNAFADRGTWHFIGTLQSKKVKKMIDKFDYIHSLERISLAKEIQKRSNGKIMKCFVQVNISMEATKAGLAVDEVVPFIRSLEAYPAIKVVGLMTMAPFVENREETRLIFRKLRELQQEVQALNISFAPCDELSMGMSNDYVIAVEEGATYVRIGSALVGKEI